MAKDELIKFAELDAALISKNLNSKQREKILKHIKEVKQLSK